MFSKNSSTRFDLASVPPVFKAGFCHEHRCLSLETIQENCRNTRKVYALVALAIGAGILALLLVGSYLSGGPDVLKANDKSFCALASAITLGCYTILALVPSAEEKKLNKFIRAYNRFLKITPMLSRIRPNGSYTYPSDPNQVGDFIRQSLEALKTETSHPGRYEVLCSLLEPFSLAPAREVVRSLGQNPQVRMA